MFVGGGGGGGVGGGYFPEKDNQIFGAGYLLVLGTNLGWWCQHLWVDGK